MSLSVEAVAKRYGVALQSVRDIAFQQWSSAEAREYFEQALLLAEQFKDVYGIASANEKLEKLAQSEEAG
jgi:hypothetical protein